MSSCARLSSSAILGVSRARARDVDGGLEGARARRGARAATATTTRVRSRVDARVARTMTRRARTMTRALEGMSAMDVAHALDAARELGTHASAHASAALSAMDAGALVDADASARGGMEIANVSDAAVAVDGSPLMDAMKAVRAEERAAKIASGEIAAPQRMEGWLAPVSDALEKLLFSIQGQLQALGVPYSTGNAIIIVTILVKAVTFPLTKDQVVSSLNMKNLQPQIAALREKYADDEERMNVEINRAYEENNVNPLAGCGPALLTFPVLAGLYRAFNNAGVDGAFDEAWFFIPSLAGPTDTRDLSWLLPLDSDFAPPIGWDEASLYLIFPILTTISQFVSMEVLKPEENEQTDEMKNQSVLLKLLPLFIGYISLTVPAGLALYWFWNNVFTTGIQVFLRNGGAQATVEAPEGVNIKIPLGCVAIPEDAEFLEEGEEYTGPSIIWNEEWLAEWRAKEAEKAPEYAMQSALEAGMNEEEAKKMEEMMKNRLPRKKKLEERKIATETELKALIREFKGRGEDATVLEEGLVALRAYKAELKAKESDSQPEPVGNSS
tara:strand:+ start:2510 stop:4180 length:1671 start_codon:yes stop_codon:yes gene_type:complete